MPFARLPSGTSRVAWVALTLTAGCFSSSSSAPGVQPEPDGGTEASTPGADASDSGAPEAGIVDATLDVTTADSEALEAEAATSFDATLETEGGWVDAGDGGEGGQTSEAGSAPHEVIVLEGNGKGYDVTTLLAQGGSLYWTVGEVLGSSVLLGAFSAGVDGGAITTLASSYTDQAFNRICTATVDSTSLYWIACGGSVTVVQIPLTGTDGGPPNIVATGLSNTAYSVAAASGQVYFATGPTTVVTTQALESAPASGAGPITALTPGTVVNRFDIDGTNAYWTSPATGAPYDAGTLIRAPLGGVPDGGSPTTMAGGLIFPSAIKVYGGNVYFIDDGDYQNDDAVMTMPVGGAADAGAPTTLLYGAGVGGPLAVDADGVFVEINASDSASDATGSLLRIPLDGGAPVTIATGIGTIAAIATDATNVYWVDSALDIIAKTTKY
jgi:hypothetical protein